jgi:hypothetical protein
LRDAKWVIKRLGFTKDGKRVQRIQNELLDTIRALESIEYAAIQMLQKCPADDDATDIYWQAVCDFKDAVEKARMKRVEAAVEAFAGD